MRTIAVPSDDLEAFDRVYVSDDITERLWSMLRFSLAESNGMSILRLTFSTLCNLATISAELSEKATRLTRAIRSLRSLLRLSP